MLARIPAVDRHRGGDEAARNALMSDQTVAEEEMDQRVRGVSL